MTQGRAPLSSGRYVPVTVNGTRQWVRDQVTLQAEIKALLEQHGGLTKKRIITSASTAQSAVDAALSAMLEAGSIERYRAKSARHRMDEHFCIAGRSAARNSAGNTTQYNALAILSAMQQHAAIIHAGSANK